MLDTMKFIAPNNTIASLSNHHQSHHTASTIPRFTIIYALRKGYFNLVRHLLRNGDNPNQTDDKDKNKRTPLIYCAFIKDDSWALSIAQNLLEYGGLLEKSDKKSLNALHYCCAFNKYRLLELLLNSLDFDLLQKVDLNGNNCLHYATRFRNLKCVRLILNKCKQYNLKTIEVENLFGFKPTDMLGLSESHYGKELDDKCRLIIKNYDKNLLANRKSFDNIANRMPLAHLESIAAKSESPSNSNRPITAPIGPKPLESSSPNSLGSNNHKNANNSNAIQNGDQMAINCDDELNMSKKHKISFNVIPPSPSSTKNTTPPNSLNNAITNRPFSTQSHKLFKLSAKIDSDNLLGTSLRQHEQELVSPRQSLNLRHSKSSVSFERKTSKSLNNSQNSHNPDNQLLVDLNELSHYSIAFNDLCKDKEHIVNPNGRVSDIVVINSYHRHRNNSTKMRDENNTVLNSLPGNHAQLIRTLSAARQRHVSRPQTGLNETQPLKPPSTPSPKLTRSPTNLGLASGRQSRQSFFGGFLVASQSDVLDQMTYNDSDDVGSGFYAHNPFQMKNDQAKSVKPQYEIDYESCVGWRKTMRGIITELEYKESPSYRKTIHPPMTVPQQSTSPTVDLNSSNDFSDRSKLGSTKKDKKGAKSNRLSSAVSTTSVLNNRKKH